MSIQYKTLPDHGDYLDHFGVKPPKVMGARELAPGEQGVFIRRHPDAHLSDNAVPQRQALLGRFGLPTPWAQDEEAEYKYLAIACGETVSNNKVFSDLWRKGQRCIIPIYSYQKKMYYNGRKPQKSRVSKDPFGSLGVAGLWSAWKTRDGVSKHRYVMVTVNADAHPLMRHFRYRDSESRMLLILPEDKYDIWLNATPEESQDLILNCPAAELKVSPSYQAHLIQQL